MPSLIGRYFTRARQFARQFPARFGRDRYCPCCGRFSGRFLPLGDYDYNRREDAICPWCNSGERHRLLIHYLNRPDNGLKKGSRILHFAPEKCLARHLNGNNGYEYLSADLFRPAMAREDITHLSFGNDTFDLILCSHVLDHVPEDTKAMRELHRVLRPGGRALILCLVDQNSEKTKDSPPEDAPARSMGSACIRVYGRDLSERLQHAGFEVERVDERLMLTEEQRRLFGVGPKGNPKLLEQDIIYVCRK